MPVDPRIQAALDAPLAGKPTLFKLPPAMKVNLRAYAAHPGSGPRGETCRTCAHSYGRQFSKTYWKCDLVKATGGAGTDIKLRSPACSRWEARPHG